MKTPREVDKRLSELLPRLGSARSTILRYEEIGRKRVLSAWEREILDNATTKHAELKAEVDPLEAIYREKPWKRYFIVSGGHIHRGYCCSTCYPTTSYGWLVDLSDCDEGAMIEAHGVLACTVCFPNAPVHPAYKRDETEKAAEEAAKAKKVCPGSGVYIPRKPGAPIMYRRYAKCPECNEAHAVTPSGKIRKHNTPKPKKGN